jgi:hypothetical protein
MKDRYVPVLGLSRDAFWVSPLGQAVQVTATHIEMICSHPERFGLTAAQLRDVFARHGEKWAIEGKAREEILLALIKRGWIRTRNYGNDGWTLNVGEDSPAARRKTACFFGQLLERNPRIKYEVVHYDHPAGRESMTVLDFVQTFSDGGGTGAPDDSAPIEFVRDPRELHDPLEQTLEPGCQHRRGQAMDLDFGKKLNDPLYGVTD